MDMEMEEEGPRMCVRVHVLLREEREAFLLWKYSLTFLFREDMLESLQRMKDVDGLPKYCLL